MRTLIIPDTHIASKYIPELRDIFEEILSIDADRCIHLGDYFDNNKLNPEEIKFGVDFGNKLVEKYNNVIVLNGNGRHEWLGNYGITDFLMGACGIPSMGMEHVVKIDGKTIFLGHGMTNQSRMEYGSHEYTVKALRKYDYAILGHQHQPQQIEGNIFHVGSAFYQHFNEVLDDHKRVALIEDGELKFIPLKTPIKMYDAYDINELPNIPAKSKVRMVIKSFNDFKSWVDKITEFKNKFYDFQIKLDFQKVDHKMEEVVEEKLSSMEIFEEEVENIEDSDVKNLIKDQIVEVIK